MKIINDGKAYIQLEELSNLINIKETLDITIPNRLWLKIINEVMDVNDYNKYDFIVIEEPDEVEFFKNLDMIADYMKYEDVQHEIIKNELIEIAKQIDEVIIKYQNLPHNKKRKYYSENSYELMRLKYKFNSLKEILLYKSGELEFELPLILEHTKKKEKVLSLKKIIEKFNRK